MNKPTALITGPSSGIGEALTNRLLTLGYRVIGVSRNPAHAASHPDYRPLACDLSDTDALIRTLTPVAEEEPVSLLINNAGIGYFALHEELTPGQIASMTALNLIAPMVITRLFLRGLKARRGTIIHLASHAGRYPSPFGAAYGATKAGLAHFSESLFEEGRKTGLKVVTIAPDMTRTPFFDQAGFAPGEEPDAHLTPECIADAVEHILNQREGTVITEIVLRPQKLRIAKRKRINEKN